MNANDPRDTLSVPPFTQSMNTTVLSEHNAEDADLSNLSILSAATNVHINSTSEIPMKNTNINAFDEMKSLKLKYPKNIFLGHLNINSIPNKFNGIMDLVKDYLDIFLISETKIDSTFPESQFHCQGYTRPFRRDRSLGAGGLLLYINDDIPSVQKNDHPAPNDVEIVCVEINLRKQKWLITGIYRPPQHEHYILF